jgi:hypothetical protein
MTIDDIMLEQQLHKLRHLDTAWAKFEAEAHQLDAARRGGTLAATRSAIAAGLVRLSIWIDRRAGERAFS